MQFSCFPSPRLLQCFLPYKSQFCNYLSHIWSFVCKCLYFWPVYNFVLLCILTVHILSIPYLFMLAWPWFLILSGCLRCKWCREHMVRNRSQLAKKGMVYPIIHYVKMLKFWVHYLQDCFSWLILYRTTLCFNNHERGGFFNPFPGPSKLRVCRQCFLKFVENGRKFSKRVENAVRKGEIACYEQFLLFPLCFLKTCTADT